MKSHATLALVVLFAVSSLAPAAEGAGTLKGQVVWGKDDIPKRAPIDVNKDQGHCLSKGPLLSETYVVNPKNKGLRSVVVWLIDASDPKRPKSPPVPPELKSVKGKVEFDQPCCMFEPHVVAIREGQTLVAKNSSPVAHNVNLAGGLKNPNLNQVIPPGGELPITGFVASLLPVQVSCNIHPWMKGYVRVFDHPYYAVTDEDGKFEIKNAPAGKWHLALWQGEGYLFLNAEGRPDWTAKPVEVKADGSVDLGKIEFVPAKK